MAETGLRAPYACGQGDVAIIGMACIFPKAPNLQTYWQNIVSKVDAISEPPAGSMSEKSYDPTSTANDKLYCKRGGYVHDLPPFKPADFGIMPVALDGAEPEHFLALKVAYDALVDAGFPDKPFNRERTGVILGRGTFVNRPYIGILQHVLVVDQTIEIIKELHPEHTPEELEAIRTRLKADLPPFNPDTAPGLPHSVMAGIIANRLDLKGPTMVIDAACASSLLALEIGMRDLVSGKCDVSVVGGVQISTAAPLQMLFTQLGALSRLPHLRPFDRQADGTMLGEGIGMIVLKRKEDAVRDGHRIYALVKGVGASSDGKGKGILAPQVDGEELALRRAYDAAQVSPDTIGLIEAHGTALPLGDVTEIEALRRVFGGRDGGPPRMALGTVKSMIGHLIPAAGIAGIIKTAFSLYHKIMPPTLHVEEPNPQLGIENTPFYLNTETRPWIHGALSPPRRAGVNAFGFGGINTHAIMEEYDDQASQAGLYHRTWENELVLIDGASRAELISRCEAALDFLAQQSDAELVDIAYTLNLGLEKKPYRLAIVAESRENLTQKLNHAIGKLKDPGRNRIKDRSGVYFFENALARQGKLAFLFPGEGSQYVNMLRDLCQHFPEVRHCFDLLDRAFIGHPQNYLPSQVIFPPTTQDSSAAEAKIWEIDGAVDAVITADRALFRLLTRLGIAPDGIVGHSSGELMAIEAAGAVALNGDADLVQFIKDGNRMLRALSAAEEIPAGVLMAVGGVERPVIDAVIDSASDFLVLAMDNCPHQYVLCGTDSSIAEAKVKFVEQGGLCQTLPFKRAYHTERFEPVLKPLREYFQHATVIPPAIPMYSCMTARQFPPDPEIIRRDGELQWARPVRFRETIATLYDEGFRIFVEVGPRGNLVSFVNDILKGKEFVAVASNLHHRSGISQLNHALGLLAAHGLDLDLSILYKHRAPRKLVETAASRAKPRPGEIILSRELPILSLGKMPLPTRRDKREAPLQPQTAPGDLYPAQGTAGGYPQPENPGQAVLPEQPRAVGGGGQEAGRGLPAAADTTMTPRPEVQAVMQEYLATMEDFLETQEQIMLAYIQGPAGPQGLAEPVPAVPPRPAEPQARPASFPVSPAAAASPAAVQPPAPDVEAAAAPPVQAPELPLAARIFAIISEKTGYPVDMLNETQNLEADLGIDSIKRLEILGMLLQQLGLTAMSTENFASLGTVAEIVALLEQEAEIPGSRQDSAAPVAKTEEAPPDAAFPELPPVLRPQGRLTHLVPGQEIRVERRLDLREDLFLRHHTLGAQVSQADPELTALPIVPLSMSLEMMAAAASLLAPHLSLTGMKNIQVRDWLAVTGEHLDLAISAQVQGEAATVIAVQLRILEGDPDPGELPRPAVEGLMIFGETYAAAPPAEALPPGIELPSVPTPEEFYPQALFHGPLFRSVREIRQASEASMEALLEVPAAGPFFRDHSAPHFLTNPVFLDAAGQVVGLWALSTLESTFVIFPARLDEAIFYRPLGTLTGPVLGRVFPRLEGNSRIVSDIQLVAPDGTVVAQLRGMHHNRARLAKILHEFRGSREIRVSQPWGTPLAHLAPSGKVVCNRLDPLPVDWHEPDGVIWLNVLAHIILSREERRTWRQFTGPDKRRLEWLLARLTGKEAVRRLLQECCQIDVWLADIEIYPDNLGKPLVRGAWLHRVAAAPALSLTHSQGVAAALAWEGGTDLSLGIDIEFMHRPGKGFTELAFAPEEQHLLPPPESPEFLEWALRCWCAKEAVAKALGKGLTALLRDLEVVNVNRETGEVQVSLSQKLAQDYPFLADRPVQAFTAREGEIIVASCFVGAVSRNPETAQGPYRNDLKVAIDS
jgi:acyl transferase domain-containing protein/phosphopantetheinyl transferase (holo-ACP synthase)/acyl carrier protein